MLIGVEVDTYLEIVKILFSPKVISRTPLSQPSFYQPMAKSSGLYRYKAPLMTLLTLIFIWKSLRSLDESNLDIGKY